MTKINLNFEKQQHDNFRFINFNIVDRLPMESDLNRGHAQL